mmetsp:Transcript_23260/g.53543  ORF Transcript_23260/g.53543 Transcript_23260/m.53543 type:complete len:87 (+) Transcript_23260:524-784(+)
MCCQQRVARSIGDFASLILDVNFVAASLPALDDAWRTTLHLRGRSAALEQPATTAAEQVKILLFVQVAFCLSNPPLLAVLVGSFHA